MFFLTLIAKVIKTVCNYDIWTFLSVPEESLDLKLKFTTWLHYEVINFSPQSMSANKNDVISLANDQKWFKTAKVECLTTFLALFCTRYHHSAWDRITPDHKRSIIKKILYFKFWRKAKTEFFGFEKNERLRRLF